MSETITILFSIFTAITTIFYIRETYLMRKFQNMPEIAMQLKFAEANATLLYLIIENIGTGVARNVKFKVLKNYQHYKDSDNDSDLAHTGIIKNGLQNFYPKQNFKYLIDHTAGKWEEKKIEEIIIEVSYSSFFFKRKCITHSMTVEQYAGGSRVTPGDTYIAQIADSLGQLQKDITKLREIIEKK